MSLVGPRRHGGRKPAPWSAFSPLQSRGSLGKLWIMLNEDAEIPEAMAF